MGFFKTLIYKIGKAYKEINWLRWVTLMVVFIGVELAILIPHFSKNDDFVDDSVSSSQSNILESSQETSSLDGSSIIIESSSREESSSVEESSSEESSSLEESSSEESSSEESSSDEESSSTEESSSEESSSEESSSTEESSSEDSSSEESSSSVEENSSENSSSVEESSSEESSSVEDSSSEKDSSSNEDDSCRHMFKWTGAVVNPTCEQPGGLLNVCEFCGEEKINPDASQPAKGHLYIGGECVRCHKLENPVDSSSEEDSSSVEESSSESGSSSVEDSSFEGSSSEEESSILEDDDTVVSYTLKYTLSNDEEYYICTGIDESAENKNPRNIVIPDTYNSLEVREIAEAAFRGSYALNSVTIGKKIDKIGENAFAQCFNLVEVYNLSSLTLAVGSDDDSQLTLFAKTIYTDLNEKSSIEYINDFIVYPDRNGLLLIGYKGDAKNLEIPHGVKAINRFAFSVNNQIESVTLSNTVKKISSYAFKGCAKLTSVTLGSGVNVIEAYAFDDTGLTSLTFHTDCIKGWKYGETALTPKETEILGKDPQESAKMFLKGSEKRGYTWTRS